MHIQKIYVYYEVRAVQYKSNKLSIYFSVAPLKD